MTFSSAMRVAMIVLLLGAAEARAQEIPTFDVEKHCRSQSKLFGNSNFMLSACYSQEQEAYDSVKADWDTLDGKIKKNCIAQAKAVLPSYFMLQACVEQEVAAQEDVKNFKFRR